jgi:hypothetical protein
MQMPTLIFLYSTAAYYMLVGSSVCHIYSYGTGTIIFSEICI